MEYLKHGDIVFSSLLDNILIKVGDTITTVGGSKYTVIGTIMSDLLVASSTIARNNGKWSKSNFSMQDYLCHNGFSSESSIREAKVFDIGFSIANVYRLNATSKRGAIDRIVKGVWKLTSSSSEQLIDNKENEKMESDLTMGLKGNFKIIKAIITKDGILDEVAYFANTINSIKESAREVDNDLGVTDNVISIINLADNSSMIKDVVPKVVKTDDREKYLNTKIAILKLDIMIQNQMFSTKEEIINAKAELSKLEEEVQTMRGKIIYSLKW